MRTLKLANADDGVIAINEIDEKLYRDSKGLNKSMLVKFMKSPRHYLAALNEKQETTDSMRMGTALHASLFREDPKDHFVVKKKVDGRTAEGKAYNAEFDVNAKGRAVINEEQDEIVKGMLKSLHKSPKFEKMYKGTTYREMGIFSQYKHDAGNFAIKGMLDGYNESEGIVYDVKSSQDASIDSFKWDFKRYEYGLQQVHYTQLITDANLPFREFIFVVVENKPPFEVAYYTLSMEEFIKTRSRWKQSMDFFGQLNAKDDFDIGYPSGTYELSY